ncbi:YidC/Oxa1 family membrane protein insertase [Streptomyces sp. NPDC086091]|uniref:YidC/Oxa1 family membrane protein insertase n=1 Tax=Streptomyces sp. NPDC086091 TaxID=3365751 RepID=UPI00382F24D6
MSTLSPLPAFVQLVEGLADLLAPLFATSATAAAIVLFTAFVRLLVHPLSRASVRGQRARAVLAPRIAELRRRHGRDPERFKRALLDLHAREKVSPLSGILPSLLQAPAFLVLYYVFSHATVGGEPNGLLTHRLFEAPLGDRWADAVASGGVFGGAGVVYLGLFAVVAAVSTYSYRWTRRQASASGGSGGGGGAVGAEGEVPGVRAVVKVMPFLSFFTLITVAVVPLAATLYVVTSTAWGVVERAALMRGAPRRAPLGAEGETVRSSPRP